MFNKSHILSLFLCREKDALQEEIGRLQQDVVSTKNQHEELVEAKEQLMKEVSGSV